MSYARYNGLAGASSGGGGGGVTTVGPLDGQPANANGLAISGTTIYDQSADATHPGVVNNTTQSFSGNKTFTGTIAASNLSGTNTGDVTLNAFGSTPNADGLSISGQALTLQPADATNPGAVSNTTQSFAGNKTFTGTIAASNLSGTNSGDVTLGSFGSAPNANGLSITGQVLNAQPADGTHPGDISLSAQTLGAGVKTMAGVNSTTLYQLSGSAFLSDTGDSTNVLVGNGQSSTLTGTQDTLIGYQAGASLTTGTRLVFIGHLSGAAATTDNDCVGIGDKTLVNMNGSGGANVAIGSSALSNLTTGQRNNAIGNSALQAVTTTNNNVAQGASSLFNTTGNNSVGVGYEALLGTNADNNTGVGYLAGMTATSGGTCTFLGASSDVVTATLSNAMALGYNAKINASNAANIGNSSVNVGIAGVNSNVPTARLHLPAGTATAGSAPFKLTAGTNLTAPEAGAIEFDGTNLYYTNSTPTRLTISTGGSGANTALSNLTNPTSVNQSLITSTSGLNLGATTSGWQNLYLSNIIFDGSNLQAISVASRTLKNPSGATLLDWSGSNLNANTHQINNVVDPTSAQDAATKNYVDSVASPTGSYWAGYTASPNTWSTSSNTYADPTPSSGNAVTQRQGNGITVSAGASNLPSISFSPAASIAVYLITAAFNLSVTSATDYAAVRITDGTTVVVTGGNNEMAPFATADSLQCSLTGIYVPGTTSAVTLKVQLASNGTATMGASARGNTDTPAIEWSLIRIF